MFKIHFIRTLFPLMLICLLSDLLSLAFRTKSSRIFLNFFLPQVPKNYISRLNVLIELLHNKINNSLFSQFSLSSCSLLCLKSKSSTVFFTDTYQVFAFGERPCLSPIRVIFKLITFYILIFMFWHGRKEDKF